MNIAPTAPAAPRGVKKPNARERPPPTSPRIIRLVQNQAGLNPCFCIPCTALVNPEPPNQPNLCAPCAASVSPATRRRMRRATLIVIIICIFLSRVSEWRCLQSWKPSIDCNLYDYSIEYNCSNVKYSLEERLYRFAGGSCRVLRGESSDPDALQDGSERMAAEEFKQIALGFGSHFLQDRLHPCVHAAPAGSIPHRIFRFDGLIDLCERDVF